MDRSPLKSLERSYAAILGIPGVLIMAFAYLGQDYLFLVILGLLFALAAAIGWHFSKWERGRHIGSNVAFVR